MIDRWFPSNATSFKREGHASSFSPSVRLVCFHGAGSDSSMFTSRGTSKRPLPNPLLTFCVENNIQLLSAHLPGRTFRINEPFTQSISAITETVLNLLEPVLLGGGGGLAQETVPLVVVGHSLGALIAYEFCCLIRQRGFALPQHLILSCMVAPDLPKKQRPWRPVDELPTSQDLQRECREWSINEEVFTADIWQIYEPILRADLLLLDRYSFTEPVTPSSPYNTFTRSTSGGTSTSATSPTSGSSPGSGASVVTRSSFHAPLGITTTVFHATEDKRITPDLAQSWKKVILGSNLFTSSPSGFGTLVEGSFQLKEIHGNHNFFYQENSRSQWMQEVVEILDKVLIDLEYS